MRHQTYAWFSPSKSIKITGGLTDDRRISEGFARMYFLEKWVLSLSRTGKTQIGFSYFDFNIQEYIIYTQYDFNPKRIRFYSNLS